MNAPIKPLCLLPDELAQWTGRRQPKRQIQWLSEHGFRFLVGGDGLPKVDREYVDELRSMPTPLPPHEFLTVDVLRRKARSVRKQCGVYFLFDMGELVYVGQTKDFARRVRSHGDKKAIQFDSVTFVRVPWEWLDQVEAEYIARFRPKHNKAGNR